MKEKSRSEVSIIGGADGPTSVFIAGKTWKRPITVRIRNMIYKFRRKMVENKVIQKSDTGQIFVSKSPSAGKRR